MIYPDTPQTTDIPEEAAGGTGPAGDSAGAAEAVSGQTPEGADPATEGPVQLSDILVESVGESDPPPADPGEPAQPGTPGKKPKKVKKKHKARNRIILIVILAAVAAVVAFIVYKLVFAKPESELLTDTAMMGSITNTVEGYGFSKAQKSASITLSTGGLVEEVFVKEGDFVEEGTPLYTIDSSSAYEALEEAQKTVSNYEKQLQAIYDSYNDLTITIPFSGWLDLPDEAQPLQVGDAVAAGVPLATLVDDSKMKLTLYFNNTYEGDVYVGQQALVSIPVSMTQVSATVEEVNRVRYVTPEGTVCFQAVLVMDNPGSLTADMGATAVLTGSGGEDIYAYDSGKLAFYRTQDITPKVSGEVLAVNNLMDYAIVDAGDTLLEISGEDNDEQIATLENQLSLAQENLEKVQENLDNFNAVAPMSGTVLACSLIPGEEVAENTTAIIIADTSVMTVEIEVDERNINYVKMGMNVDLTDWNGNSFTGTVTSISMTGNTENGATSYPVTISTDNPDGTLMSNMSVNYSFTASQVDNALVIPVQSVKNISDAEGNAITVAFVQKDRRPDNAVEVPEGVTGVPTEKEGFYAVPVELGINDVYSVQILSGLEEGDVVFTSYMNPDDMMNMAMVG